MQCLNCLVAMFCLLSIFLYFFTHTAVYTTHNQAASWRQRSCWHALRHPSCMQGQYFATSSHCVSHWYVFEHMPQAPGYARVHPHSVSSIEILSMGTVLFILLIFHFVDMNQTYFSLNILQYDIFTMRLYQVIFTVVLPVAWIIF